MVELIIVVLTVLYDLIIQMLPPLKFLVRLRLLRTNWILLPVHKRLLLLFLLQLRHFDLVVLLVLQLLVEPAELRLDFNELPLHQMELLVFMVGQ